jgi:hypothetical protein
MNQGKPIVVAAVFAAALMLGNPAQAGLFRAYLSSTGNDANPCTIQAPCRLLPAALAAVNSGGEIWILDSANYNTGPVNVDRSVNILAIPGAVGSFVGNGGDALVLGTTGTQVALHNLTILNLSAGTNGINVLPSGGSKLMVDHCLIHGFSGGAGIMVNNAAQVSVVDSVLHDNGNGIQLDGGATTTISRSHFLGNGSAGVLSLPTSAVIVRTFINDSVLNGNTYGAVAQAGSGTSKMSITRTVASGNSLDGFETSTGGGGSSIIMIISGSTATGNGRWGITNFAGTLRSDGTNVSSDNTSGDSNGTITPMSVF